MGFLNELQQCVYKGVPYKPLLVKLKLLDNCNLKCRMCNHWKYASHIKKHHFYYPIIDELAALGCKKIHITGGEPLLYPKLNKILKYIRDNYRQIQVSMTTNGTLIDEAMAEMLFNCGVDAYSISIDSPEPNIHDSIRGVEGAFTKTCKGIGNLKKSYGLFPVNICINTLITPWNYKTLFDLPRLANELGANDLNFIPLHIHNQNSHLLSEDQIREFKETIIPVLLSEAAKYKYDISKEDLIEESDVNNMYLHQPCYALWTHLVIDPHGKVFPCCVLRGTEVGGLNNNTITEIWNGEVYQRLRQTKNLPIHQDCLRCKVFFKRQESIMKLIGNLS